jgi:hypothetical protein
MGGTGGACPSHPSYLTLGRRAGIDLRTLQDLAGHSKPELTARYSHRRLYDLAGAVDKLPNLVPAGLAFVSDTPSQGNYNSGTGVWTVGTVTTTAAPTLQIQATVFIPNPQTNTATVSADLFNADPDVPRPPRRSPALVPGRPWGFGSGREVPAATATQRLPRRRGVGKRWRLPLHPSTPDYTR